MVLRQRVLPPVVRKNTPFGDFFHYNGSVPSDVYFGNKQSLLFRLRDYEYYYRFDKALGQRVCDTDLRGELANGTRILLTVTTLRVQDEPKLQREKYVSGLLCYAKYVDYCYNEHDFTLNIPRFHNPARFLVFMNYPQSYTSRVKLPVKQHLSVMPPSLRKSKRGKMFPFNTAERNVLLQFLQRK